MSAPQMMMMMMVKWENRPPANDNETHNSNNQHEQGEPENINTVELCNRVNARDKRAREEIKKKFFIFMNNIISLIPSFARVVKSSHIKCGIQSASGECTITVVGDVRKKRDEIWVSLLFYSRNHYHRRQSAQKKSQSLRHDDLQMREGRGNVSEKSIQYSV